MTKKTWTRFRCLLPLAIFALSGCHGGGDAGDQLPPPATYSIGGGVTGATGAVVLANSNGDSRSVTADGPFTFGARLTSGSAYAVTVTTPPAGQSCVVTSGSGTVAAANVTNVLVTCARLVYHVGGALVGLATGKSVRLNLATDLQSVDLTLAANGAFAFAANVVDGALYTVTVTTQPVSQQCTVTNGEAIARANVNNVSVTCVDVVASARAWSAPAAISRVADYPPVAAGLINPDVAFDAAGNGLAVWEYNVTPTNDSRTYWSRFTPSGGWSTPVAFADQFDAAANVERRNPKLGMAPNGNAIVVWASKIGFYDNAVASFYTPAGGWGAAHVLTKDPVSAPPGMPVDEHVANMKIHMDNAGNVLLVWQNETTNFYDVGTQLPGSAQVQVILQRISYNRYKPGAGWTYADPNAVPWGRKDISSNSPSLVFEYGPEISVNAGGEVVALWMAVDRSTTPFTRTVWSNRYDMATDTWTTPALVGSGDDGAANKWRAVTLDNSGVATALWSHREGTKAHLLFNRTTNGVWGTPAIVETNNADAHSLARQPRAVVNAAGVVTAVWTQRDENGGHYVANHYLPGTGWLVQHDIGDYPRWGVEGDETDITVVNNATGDAVVLWTRTPLGVIENMSLPTDVWANEYNWATSAWGAGKVIGRTTVPAEYGDNPTRNPAVAIKANGDAVAVWQQEGLPAVAGIFTSRFE
jgi:hypothetical protein